MNCWGKFKQTDICIEGIERISKYNWEEHLNGITIYSLISLRKSFLRWLYFQKNESVSCFLNPSRLYLESVQYVNVSVVEVEAASGGLLLEAVYMIKDWIRLKVCGVCGTFERSEDRGAKAPPFLRWNCGEQRRERATAGKSGNCNACWRQFLPYGRS